MSYDKKENFFASFGNRKKNSIPPLMNMLSQGTSTNPTV